MLESSCRAIEARRVANLGFTLYAFYHRQWWFYSHVPRLQDSPDASQRVGLASGGGGHDCRLYLREYRRGELSGSLGNRAQRMERVQEISHQGGPVPICLHHVCQDLDRAPNLCTRYSIRGGQFSDQDADLRRHHRFLASHLRPMHAKVSLLFLLREPGRTFYWRQRCSAIDWEYFACSLEGFQANLYSMTMFGLWKKN